MSAFLGFNAGTMAAATTLPVAASTLSTILTGLGWQMVRQSVNPTSVIGTFTTSANALDMTSTTYATTTTLPQYLGAQLTGGFTPTVMYLQADNLNAAGSSQYTPMNFTLDYSSNGSTWTTLQSWYGQTNWTSCERRKFVITGATSQVYWRINVLNAQLGGTCYIGEWTLEDSTGRWLTNNVFFDLIPPTGETIGDSYSRECMRWSLTSTTITIGGVQETLVSSPQMLSFHTSTAGAVTSGVAMNNDNQPTSGGFASFATNVMTLVTAPTSGNLTMGSWVSGTSVPAGTIITSLLSGTMGVAGSTYTLSTTPGTIASEAIVTGLVSLGGTASVAGTVLTLQSSPTVGTLAVGQLVSLPGNTNNPAIVALASGTLNAVGSTYTLSASMGTLATNSLVTLNSPYATGLSASFATNVMTVTVATTAGSLMVGQTVLANGVASGTTIMSLVSGTLNAIGSTYSLSTSPGTVAAATVGTLNGAVVSFAGSAPNTTNQNARGLYEACRTSTLLNFTAWNWVWPTNLVGTFGVGQFLAVQVTPQPNWPQGSPGTFFPIGYNISSVGRASYNAANIVQGSQIPLPRSCTIDVLNGWIYYLQTCRRGVALGVKTNAAYAAPIHACYATNAEVLAQVPVSDLASYGLPCTISELVVGYDDAVANTGGFAYPTHWWGVALAANANVNYWLDFNAQGAATSNMGHHLVSGQLQDFAAGAVYTNGTGNPNNAYLFATGEGLFTGGDSGQLYTIQRMGIYPQLLFTYVQNQNGTDQARYTGICATNLDWYKFTGTAPTAEQILIGPSSDFQTTVNALGTTSDTTITVVDTTGFPTAAWIYIDGEIIQYTGKTGTTFTGCTRARYNTTAIRPLVGTTVYVCGWWVFMISGLIYAGYQTPT